MSNELGAQIALEVARAENDMQTFRSRGQAVLALAGGLVTALVAILALGTSTANLALNNCATVAATVALLLFFAAAGMVALMMRPATVDAPTVQTLRDAVGNEWDNPRIDETVALSNLTHLEGIRRVNGCLATLLSLAVAAQVAGLLSVLALALIFVCST